MIHPCLQPTAEQIRIAQITELKTGNQDPTHEKVIQLMEMTERSEEDACLALYECDNDVGRAVIYLLENLEIGAVMTTSKKKKNKSSTADDEDSTANVQRDSSKDERPRNQKSVLSKGKSERGGRIRPSGESHNDRPNNARPRTTMNSRRGGFSGENYSKFFIFIIVNFHLCNFFSLSHRNSWWSRWSNPWNSWRSWAKLPRSFPKQSRSAGNRQLGSSLNESQW